MPSFRTVFFPDVSHLTVFFLFSFSLSLIFLFGSMKKTKQLVTSQFLSARSTLSISHHDIS